MCVRCSAMDLTSPKRTAAGAKAEADLARPSVSRPVLREGEPAAGPWREVTVSLLLTLLGRGEVPAGRPRVVATAGRGGRAVHHRPPAWGQ